MTEPLPVPGPHEQRTVPPWQIVVPVVVLGVIALFIAVMVIGALVDGDYVAGAILGSSAVAAGLVAILVGLLRRWRAARFLGFLVGVALVVLGIYVYGQGSSGIEPVVGLAIAIPLATRSAQSWMRRT